MPEKRDDTGLVALHQHTDSLMAAAARAIKEAKDPNDLIRAAAKLNPDVPGGVYYRSKLWNRAKELATAKHNGATKAWLERECVPKQIRLSVVREIDVLATAIATLDDEGIDTGCLARVPPRLFQLALRQKSLVSQYLRHVVARFGSDELLSAQNIHHSWCQIHGSLKSRLDIIKPSDWWAFGRPKWPQAKDFPGSIPGEVYANALYYFAPLTGTAVDPMAGSGMLQRVYDDRDRWQRDLQFALDIRLFDIEPKRPYIQKHNAEHKLPVTADWIFLDPPYFSQGQHLYSGELAAAVDYEFYLARMQRVIAAMNCSLRDGGRICLLLPKWSGLNRDKPNHDLAGDCAAIARKIGLHWVDSAYVSRGRQQRRDAPIHNNRAKEIRRMMSDTCVLNVFEKGRRA